MEDDSAVIEHWKMKEEGSQEGRILEYVPSNTLIVIPATKQTEQQSQKQGGPLEH